MIDPNTIVAPPTPTAASSAAEWDRYLEYVSTMSRFAMAQSQSLMAAAAEKAAAAQAALVAAVNTPAPAATPEVTEATFLKALEIVQGGKPA